MKKVDTSDRVYVIIVTYNGQFWIEKCLYSLTESSVPLRIIVIDNGSNDATVEIIKRNFMDHVHLVETGKNLGFGKANNIGFKIAKGEKADYVFLLNQDAWVEIGTIETLIEIHKENSHYGILSPVHLNGEKTALEYAFANLVGDRACRGFLADLYLNRNNMSPIYKTNFVNAAAWLISKDCLLRVGGFDPDFPHYGEDDNYVQRAQKKGFLVGITPLTTICHDQKNYSYENPVDKENNFNRKYVSSLLRIKDLNIPFEKALYREFKFLLKSGLSKFIRTEWKSARNDFKILQNIRKNYEGVLRNRRKSINEDGAFL